MPYLRSIIFAALMGLLAVSTFAVNAPVSASQPSTPDADVIVCPTCEETDLKSALQTARRSAVIEVRGGTHAGPFLIEQDVELRGIDNPTLDGGGVGSVVMVRNADVMIRGFTIRGTGIDLHHEDSAVMVDSGNARIESNRIENALFGIYLKNSPNSTIRDNIIEGKALPIARRGDGIRVWYCDDMIIEHNVVVDGRDVILWYSNRGIVRSNQFDHGRYGLHLMYSDQALIEGNSLRANSVGLYVMYSRDVMIERNSLSDNYGPSGAGMGLKDVDGATVLDNRFVNNHMGAQVDTSPREPNITHEWRGNVFAYNEIALGLLPSVRDNVLWENAFIDNIQNVAILGGGQLRNVNWSVEKRGNYWSDYAGYDADGDGIGDVPYRSQQLFESLTDQHPELRLFIFSPAAVAVDFAARAFPAVQPREKFVDPAPLMSPPAAVGLPPVERESSSTRLVVGTGGLVLSTTTLFAIWMGRRRAGRDVPEEGKPGAGSPAAIAEMSDDRHDAERPPVLISVRSLTKRYREITAVDAIDFDVASGEAVALWGPNGAGKTTVLRCLLGTARFEGEVLVSGLNPTTQGRDVRARIGYVPQELAPTPISVGELTLFIARLRGTDTADAQRQLERLGIADQVDKSVDALSGGLKQRLALALALMGSSRILLLDEPTANLDAAGRAALLNLLRDLKREGMTILFSSHRPDDVLALADRILMMEHGKVTESIGPERFAKLLNFQMQLVLTLENALITEAAETLLSLGYRPVSNGSVLTVPVRADEKANVLSELVRAGIAIEDFELERHQ